MSREAIAQFTRAMSTKAPAEKAAAIRSLVEGLDADAKKAIAEALVPFWRHPVIRSEIRSGSWLFGPLRSCWSSLPSRCVPVCSCRLPT